MLLIDLFKVTNNHEDFNHKFDAKDLQRLPQMEPEHKTVAINLAGELQNTLGKKKRLLHVKINGEINLICNRCNQALPHKIDIFNTIDVFPTQEALDNTPIEDESHDSIVGSPDFNIQELLEEEILLSLPAFPNHDICPKHDYTAIEDKKISPFAILETFKINKQ